MTTSRRECTSSIIGRAGWRLESHEGVGSTNDMARLRPAWSAVVAAVQTGGRGRYGRSFACSRGGLWLSAVVPSQGGAARWAGFSLAVGLHLLRAVSAVGIPEIRLRWPNDLMVRDRKLGGLLVEEGAVETLVVGLGLNIVNRPWEDDASLECTAVRLADLLPRPPDVEDFVPRVLDAIADAHEDFLTRGLGCIIEELNEHWSQTPVLLMLHGQPPLQTMFLGLDPVGNLRVKNADTTESVVPHHHVEKLIETQPGRIEADALPG